MAADTVVPGADALSALILCGLMGVLGQGVRAAIGLKNANAVTSTTPDVQSTFSAAYFVLSLMIGFIAGILAGIAVGLSNFTSVDLSNIKLLLGIAASAYAGTDFIENSLSLIIPAQGVAPTVPKPSLSSLESAQYLSLIANKLPVAFPTQKINQGDIIAAFRTVAPKIDTSIWVPALMSALPKYDVTTNKRIAAGVGQFLVEAGSAFQEVEEDLMYTHADHIAAVFPHSFRSAEEAEPFVRNPVALANRVYANRLGNGDEASGDGYRFRGRGLLQLTGREEYGDFGQTVSKTAEQAADYCATPEGAALSACWYLSAKGCLPLADVWNLSAITLKVNGEAMLGNAQRIAFSNAFLKALGG